MPERVSFKKNKCPKKAPVGDVPAFSYLLTRKRRSLGRLRLLTESSLYTSFPNNPRFFVNVFLEEEKQKNTVTLNIFLLNMDSVFCWQRAKMFEHNFVKNCLKTDSVDFWSGWHEKSNQTLKCQNVIFLPKCSDGWNNVFQPYDRSSAPTRFFLLHIFQIPIRSIICSSWRNYLIWFPAD